MDLVEPSFDHSTFSKNRAGLLRQRVSREFFDMVVLQARARGFHPETLGRGQGLRHARLRGHAAGQAGDAARGSEHQPGRRSAIDGRTTRHVGYDLSQRIRKRVEEIFG